MREEDQVALGDSALIPFSKKPLVGRKTKRTVPRVQILMECMEEGMPVNIACDFAGIGRTSFYTWLEKDEEFRTQVAYARSKAIRELIQEVGKKDPWKILKNLAPTEFRDQVDINPEPTREFVIMAGDREIKILR